MPETLYLTVNLIDRYLAKRNVTRKRLQLVGAGTRAGSRGHGAGGALHRMHAWAQPRAQPHLHHARLAHRPAPAPPTPAPPRRSV